MIGSDDPRFWRGLLLLLTLLALSVFLAEAVAFGRYAIQDDARLFLAWTPRLADPRLMPGDLIADYWHSVSPPLYRLLYAVAVSLGITPRTTAVLIAVPLLPLTALGAWRLANRLAPPGPVAFLAAGLVVAVALQDDALLSGTPRAFVLPLLLFFYAGLLDERPIPTLLSLVLLALLYPAAAVSSFAMLGLARLRLAPRLGLDRSVRGWATVGLGAVLLLVPLLLFQGEVSGWKPILRLADLASVPAMAEPYARTTVVAEGGHLSLVCGGRIGYLPPYFPCRSSAYGAPALLSLLLFLPLAAAAFMALRRRSTGDPDRLFVLAIAATAICWAIALAAAFQLHLPSRYSQYLLRPLEMLALGRLLGMWLIRHWPAARAKWSAAVTALVLLALFAVPEPEFQRPDDAGGMDRLASSPRDARIAGIADDLSAIPALAGRSVLATSEHAIPYQLGYYRPFHQRLADTATSLRSGDRATVAEFIDRWHLDVLAVATRVLNDGTLPSRYQQALPELPARTGSASALAEAPVSCVLYRGPQMWLFDAHCVVRWAESPRPMPNSPSGYVQLVPGRVDGAVRR